MKTLLKNQAAGGDYDMYFTELLFKQTNLIST